MKVVKSKDASPPLSSIVENNSSSETSYSGVSKGSLISKMVISCKETSASLIDDKQDTDTSSTGWMHISIHLDVTNNLSSQSVSSARKNVIESVPEKV